MKALRGGTSSPISIVNMWSAAIASGSVTRIKRALGRIHRRLPKLVGVHLSKTLIALDLDPFAAIDAEEIDPFFQGVRPESLSLFIDDVKEFAIGDEVVIERKAKASQSVSCRLAKSSSRRAR